MNSRIAIDFGTANTVIARWDPVTSQGVVFHLDKLGNFQDTHNEKLSVIPSLIHYGSAAQHFYGNEVLERKLQDSPRTFQWMKRYITARSPVKRQIDSKQILHREAAQDFLKELLKRLKASDDFAELEEIVLSVPVESFEHYENWLSEMVTELGIKKLRIIDEPSAAALGYSSRLFNDEACLVFDFGAGSLDLAIVRQESGSDLEFQRCRVLGKAGAELGGSHIDQWLYEEVLSMNGYEQDDPEIRQLSRQLLSACRNLKERLSFQNEARLTVVNPQSGKEISAELQRSDLESLIEKKNGFALIDRTVRRALKDAYERGFDDDKIKAVLMVGGASQIPSVQGMLKRIFGNQRVKLEHPLDAIARGAAAFAAGQNCQDYLQHDYAIRYKNTSSNEYEYRNLINRGAAYPSAQPLSRLTIKAVYDDQDEFMMQIFQINRTNMKQEAHTELIFDETGAARINTISSADLEERGLFWINEKNPTLLKADPPARKGEERFEVSFSLDENRRLLISTRDLKSGKLILQDFPVVKLS